MVFCLMTRLLEALMEDFSFLEEETRKMRNSVRLFFGEKSVLILNLLFG